MRILSRHHDYYDWVAGYGIDLKITYPRTPRSVPPGDERVPWRMNAPLMQSTRTAAGAYLCFEVLFGIYPQTYRRWMSILHRDADSVQIRNFETLSAAEEHAESLGIPRPRRRWWGWNEEHPPDGVLDAAQWRQIGAPIFSMAPVGWPDNRLTVGASEAETWYTTDPMLADLRFTEVPAADVFQRVQSFLRLDPPPPEEFSDALKARAKGFDRRSFRHRTGGDGK